MAGKPAAAHPALKFSAAIAFLACAWPGLAADDPRAWLERMNHAVENINYEGTLVHVHGGESDVLDVVHRVENGRVTERITSQDAAGREIIRDGDEVTCFFPDRREVLVEERDDQDDAQSPLRGHLPGASSIRDAYYNVAFVGTERVTSRETRVVAIRPKDTFRYGYRIWTDRATAMPLKTELVDESGRMLEQIRFTSIRLPDRIPESAVRSTVAADAFAWQRSDARPEPPGSVAAGGDWQAADLPPGFALVARRAKVAPNSPAGLRHLVYSDGLASVSVFIEMAVAASEQAEGVSRIGAANAYTTIVAGHMVTAVGEVPVRTAQMIASSLRPVRRLP